MNKRQFLRDLEHELRSLPIEECADILSDYEEHFELGKAEGKAETEVAMSLGSPEHIARELLGNETIVSGTSQRSQTRSVIGMVFILIILFFFNLIFFVGPAMGILGALIGVSVSSIMLFLSPLFVIIGSVIRPGNTIWFDFFLALSFSGLGYFMGLATWYVGKFIIKVLRAYLNWNLKLIKGVS